jgi:omega-amidase
MKIAVFQFAAGSVITDNFAAIQRAISEAHRSHVRLLVFQECALCGYPPVETKNVRDIDFQRMDSCIGEIKELSKQCDMYIAIGAVQKSNDTYYDSILIIGPTGEFIGIYDKRALWGWDRDTFVPGESDGIYQIDEFKVGFRICYEVRFPEYFRELFETGVSLCFVSFCDVSEEADDERYGILKSHLITRAAESVMTVVSVNSISAHQTAPTAVFSPDGRVILAAEKNQESLLIYEYEKAKNSFSGEGRETLSRALLG